MTVLPKVIYSLEEFLKDNPDVKKSDIKIIHEWLDKQPHLPKIMDFHIILFFHSNYYQLEPTKSTIENYFTFKTHVSELFGNRDPFSQEIRSISKVISVIPTNKFTKEGYQIIFMNFLDPDPSHYFFCDAVKFFIMIMELFNLKTGPLNGISFIVDVQNMSLGHLARINLVTLKKLIYFVQEAAPIRLKQIYVYNCNSAVEMLLNMAKPFMKKELYDLINFTTLQKLEKLVPLDAFPNELGGKNCNLKELVNEQIKFLEDNRDYFLMDEMHYKVNESLRVGKSKFSNDSFGVDGSFKKLEVD